MRVRSSNAVTASSSVVISRSRSAPTATSGSVARRASRSIALRSWPSIRSKGSTHPFSSLIRWTTVCAWSGRSQKPGSAIADSKIVQRPPLRVDVKDTSAGPRRVSQADAIRARVPCLPCLKGTGAGHDPPLLGVSGIKMPITDRNPAQNVGGFGLPRRIRAKTSRAPGRCSSAGCPHTAEKIFRGCGGRAPGFRPARTRRVFVPSLRDR